MIIHTVTLNPALDYVMHLSRLRYDDVNRADYEALIYGGKGINVSVMSARLGFESRALGFTAGFTGEELKRMLRDEGIVCDFTDIARGMTRINVKIRAEVELDVNSAGPEVTSDEVDALFAKLDDIREGDCLVLSGSVPKNLPEDVYEKMIVRLDGRGVRFVVDTTGESLLRVLKYRPFLIKPNHHELGDVFGVRTETEEEIIFYGSKLRDMGARNVLVSRSGDGAILLDENGETHVIGAVAGKVVNTVGSGDSMVAGFLTGCLRDGDYARALKLGAACGSATAFSEGLAPRELIDEIFNKLQ